MKQYYFSLIAIMFVMSILPTATIAQATDSNTLDASIQHISPYNGDLLVWDISSDKVTYKEGETVSIKAYLSNTGDYYLKNVGWVFYNNGYPTGEHSTYKAHGTVDLSPRSKQKIEIKFPVRSKDDTIHNTGSFITVMIVDPEEKVQETSELNNYRGTTIYVGISPSDTEDENNQNNPSSKTEEVEPKSTTSCDSCKKQYHSCLEKNQDKDSVETEFSSWIVDDKLVEGESKVYWRDSRSQEGEMITVQLLIAEDTAPPRATFKFNDHVVSPQLTEGESFEVYDVILNIKEINLNKVDQKDEVVFSIRNLFLGKETSSNVDEETIPCEIVLDRCENNCVQKYPEEVYYPIKRAPKDSTKQVPTTKVQLVECPANTCLLSNGKDVCVPISTRFSFEENPSYCDIHSEISTQKIGGEQADNYWECTSNFAPDGVCTDPGVFTKFKKWFIAFFS